MPFCPKIQQRIQPINWYILCKVALAVSTWSAWQSNCLPTSALSTTNVYSTNDWLQAGQSARVSPPSAQPLERRICGNGWTPWRHHVWSQMQFFSPLFFCSFLMVSIDKVHKATPTCFLVSLKFQVCGKNKKRSWICYQEKEDQIIFDWCGLTWALP